MSDIKLEPEWKREYPPTLPDAIANHAGHTAMIREGYMLCFGHVAEPIVVIFPDGWSRRAGEGQ
jgi:hypothetical protein